ncbi:MAG: endonuclease/exonuclease/phosphatase family protein [Armatimonas sp.]
MPYYPGLKNKEFDNRREFIAQKLIALREGLLKNIPYKTLNDNLLVATWNLRDFGREPGHGFNPEPRLGESFYYIAEIISRFDLIAVQEVNEDLDDFRRLMRILGGSYDYIATDVTEGPGGNKERMVFVFDRRKINFRNIAGEIVLPNKAPYDGIQFARTPFVVSFQCGWLKFDICTAHLYYGEESGEKYEKRVDEIKHLAGFMAERAERTGTNTFILGDFNVVGPDDKTWNALNDSPFKVPEKIKTIPSNALRTKHYDQIAFRSVQDEVKIKGKQKESAGTFDFYNYVFESGNASDYKDVAKNLGDITKFDTWRTWQMSDHLPLWIELETDFAETYLNKLKNKESVSSVGVLPQADFK